MKKIAIILSGITIGSMMITSCQQEASDVEVEAKVTEMYNEEKTRVENDLSAACDSAVSATVAAIKDSLSHLNAKQQAALLEQTRRELAAAKKKAAAASANKKKPPVVKDGGSTTTTTTTNNKPVLDNQGNQVGTPTTRGGSETVDKEKNIKKNESGNQVGTPTTR